MDGLKARLRASIQLQLSLWISLSILLVAAVGGAFSYASAFDEARELQDDVLRQVAETFDRHRVQPSPNAIADSAAQDGEDAPRVWVQFLSGAVADARALPLEPTLAPGMHTVHLRSGTYKVFVKALATGGVLAVSQDATFRDDIARENALRTLMPFLLLMPVLLLLVAVLVRRSFRPVGLLAAELDARSELDLHPIEQEKLGTEIRPFANAINRMLERVSASMKAQRRFVADAAHELRSPLAAISLQAERLASSEMSEEAEQRLRALRGGIERSRHLLDQLLTLARAEAAPVSAMERISIPNLLRELVEDLLPLAEARQIDLGVVAASGEAAVNAAELKIVLKNLIHNAIRYAPVGGRVDLNASVEGGSVVISVRDNGPGIPPEERERVFDPFYRGIDGNDTMGSGLGLSIVQTIATRLGARIRMDSVTTADGERAFLVCVELQAP